MESDPIRWRARYDVMEARQHGRVLQVAEAHAMARRRAWIDLLAMLEDLPRPTVTELLENALRLVRNGKSA